MQGGASGRRKERILRRVASDFLERATSATSNERVLQGVASDFCKKQLLQRVRNDFLELADFGRSNE